MLALLLAVLFAQALPAATASPVPALDAAWKKVPLQKDEYAHYARSEQDGTQSDIIATRQVCDCQPAHLMDMLTSALGPVKGATTAVDSISICGGTQPRFIATGLASPGSGARNMEVIAFRKEPALYMLEFTFNGAKPPAGAETALAALCP
jgi:hypothetical protein